MANSRGAVLIAGQLAEELAGVVRTLGRRLLHVEDEAALWALASSQRIDVVVLDVDFVQPLEGIRLGHELYARMGLRTIYLSAHPELLAQVKATRPYGYLLKPVRAPELGICLELALQRAEERTQTHVAPSARLPSLSARERDVLRLIAHGHTSKDIANELAIAKATVDTYRARLNEKLSVRNRAELVRVARTLGLG